MYFGVGIIINSQWVYDLNHSFNDGFYQRIKQKTVELDN